MPAKIDLTGKVFHRLTVKKRQGEIVMAWRCGNVNAPAVRLWLCVAGTCEPVTRSLAVV